MGIHFSDGLMETTFDERIGAVGNDLIIRIIF
jgi:hypothetical protein